MVTWAVCEELEDDCELTDDGLLLEEELELMELLLLCDPPDDVDDDELLLDMLLCEALEELLELLIECELEEPLCPRTARRTHSRKFS